MKRLLFIGSVNRHGCREVLRGLADEPRLLQDWIVRPHDNPATLAGWHTLLRDLEPEAVLFAEVPVPSALPELRKTERPLFSIINPVEPSLPSLLFDNVAIGRLAAEHFLERRFHEFAYVGYLAPQLYRQRAAGFAERLQLEKGPLHQYWLEPVPLRPHTDQRPQGLLDFLRTLPRHCALFAGDDELAAVILELSRASGVSVPQHLAVLGADDDSLVCQLASPPLSSLRLPYRELGRRAAQWLLAWRPARPQENQRLNLAPFGVALRPSTDVARTDDPLVVKALQYLQAHLDEPITIAMLRAHLQVTAPDLLARFRQELHSTPSAELRRLRIERAKHLLITTAAPMKKIAGRCGFKNIFHFMATFKQLAGLSVCDYRRCATADAS